MRVPKTAAGTAAPGGDADQAAPAAAAAGPGSAHVNGAAPAGTTDPAAVSTASPETAVVAPEVTPAGPPAETGSSRAPGAKASWRGQLMLALQLNWLATALFTAGLGLRVLTQASYSPALIYIDSVKYMYGAWPGADPLGYDVPLKLILAVSSLSMVEAVQHLLGLGMAVVLYLVLVRRGVPRWLAALAMAPVLLDAYQLQAEATIMPDVWFEAALFAGLAILLWQPRASLRICLLAGVVLGLSATLRQVGEVLVVPAVIFVVAGAGGWRQAIGRSAGLACAFALPVVAYCTGSYVMTGHFWLSRNGYQATYGRMAGVADCVTLRLPAYERPLCPSPAQQRLGADWLDHAAQSPLRDFIAPPGLQRSKAIADFNKSVALQQPLRVAGRVIGDASKLFAVARVTSPGDTPISRWQFQTAYPQFPPTVFLSRPGAIIFGLKLAAAGGPTIYRQLDASYGGQARVWVPGATALRGYQRHGGYAPGPLLLLGLLTGIAGALTVFRRRASAAQRQLALGALLFTLTAVVVLLMSDMFEFSWRYQIPALVTLPPAGAFGIAAMLRFARRRRTARTAAAAPQRVAART